MLTLDEINAAWRVDAAVDKFSLDGSALKTANLHAKYLELHGAAKILLKRREQEQKILLRDKWLYFNGKMEKAEMDKRSWPYDPFNGLKIMKSDMSYYFEADKDLQEQDANITYLKTVVETLENIVDMLKWRHQSLKVALDAQRFAAGA